MGGAGADGASSDVVWELASSSLRKEATAGIKGATVDHFGKPTGFSGKLHNILRQGAKAQLPGGKDAAGAAGESEGPAMGQWVTATEREKDKRHRWHRTRSEVSLGRRLDEAGRLASASHYKGEFIDRPSERRREVNSRVKTMASQYQLEDGTPQEAGYNQISMSGIFLQDPQTTYQKVKLPKTTDSTVTIGAGKVRSTSTSYGSIFTDLPRSQKPEFSNDRLRWNRTASKVELGKQGPDAVIPAPGATLHNSTFDRPAAEYLYQSAAHKERGKAKWNKSCKEFGAFAPTKELREGGKFDHPEDYLYAKTPKMWIDSKLGKEPPDLSASIEGPGGTFAFASRGEDRPDRSVAYASATASTFTEKPVAKPPPLEHVRTRSSWRPEYTKRRHYATSAKALIGTTANDAKTLSERASRFQWPRTESQISIDFLEDDRRAPVPKLRRKLKRPVDTTPVPVIPIGAPNGRHLMSHGLVDPDPAGAGAKQAMETTSATTYRAPGAEQRGIPGLRSMGAARATSQIKMHKTERTAAGFYHRMQEEYTKPAYSRRTPIKPVQVIKQHMSWEEKAGKTPL